MKTKQLFSCNSVSTLSRLMNVHGTVSAHIAYTRCQIGLDLSGIKGTLHKDRSRNSSVTEFLF